MKQAEQLAVIRFNAGRGDRSDSGRQSVTLRPAPLDVRPQGCRCLLDAHSTRPFPIACAWEARHSSSSSTEWPSAEAAGGSCESSQLPRTQLSIAVRNSWCTQLVTCLIALAQQGSVTAAAQGIDEQGGGGFPAEQLGRRRAGCSSSPTRATTRLSLPKRQREQRSAGRERS